MLNKQIMQVKAPALSAQTKERRHRFYRRRRSAAKGTLDIRTESKNQSVGAYQQWLRQADSFLSSEKEEGKKKEKTILDNVVSSLYRPTLELITHFYQECMRVCSFDFNFTQSFQLLECQVTHQTSKERYCSAFCIAHLPTRRNWEWRF